MIGWDLIVEYAIGNIAVAISWSDYFTRLLSGYGIRVPEYLTMDFLTASRGFASITEKLAAGNTLEQVRAMTDVTPTMIEAHAAWQTAPRIAGIPLVCDLRRSASSFSSRRSSSSASRNPSARRMCWSL
jgi:hypothetical protein